MCKSRYGKISIWNRTLPYIPHARNDIDSPIIQPPPPAPATLMYVQRSGIRMYRYVLRPVVTSGAIYSYILIEAGVTMYKSFINHAQPR